MEENKLVALLEDRRKKLNEAVASINALDQQKGALTQEALRLDGEVRVLQELSIGKPSATPAEATPAAK